MRMARTPMMQMLKRAVRDAAMEASGDEPRAGAEKIGRRRLIVGAAATAAAAALPLPAAAAQKSIAIVGAGLAGLSAAYELLKVGIFADVYEGNTRIGGRCWTARGIFAENQIAEHGGELIDTDHIEIRQLAAELGLTLDNVAAAVPAGAQALYMFNGKPYNLKDATRDIQPFYPQLQAQARAIGEFSYRSSTAAAKHFDAMTISDWVARYIPGGRTGQLGQLIENAFTEEDAADADQQSALNAIQTLAEDPRRNFNLYYTDSNQHFHTRGGNDQIATIIGQMLGARLQVATALTAIVRLPDGRYSLTFARDRGSFTRTYDRVILALPFSVMRVAVDFSRAGFRKLKQTAINTLPMGVSTKFQMQFNRRLWYKVGCSGEIRLPAEGFQTTWDVTRAQGGASGIFHFWSGGTQAMLAGALDNLTLAQLVMREAAPLIPGLAAQWNGLMIKNPWQQNPWSLGSYCVYPPGYQTTVVGIEAVPEGNCFFAGEHTAEQNGFLNAAVQTGQRAAGEVIASLKH
jgi:monoamine oxidase